MGEHQSFPQSRQDKQKNISQRMECENTNGKQHQLKILTNAIDALQKQHRLLQQFKKDYKQDPEISVKISQYEININQLISQLVDKVTLNKLTSDPKLLKQTKDNPNKKSAKELPDNSIDQIMKKFEQQNNSIERLKNQIQQLNKKDMLKSQKIKKLQIQISQISLSKEFMQNLFIKMEKDIRECKQQVKKVKQLLRPMKQLQDKLESLKSNNKQKTANYGQSLFWILNSTITGYRMLSIGIVTKGDNIVKGRVGGIISNISTLLGLAQNIPIIDDACGIVNSIAKFYSNASEDVIIKKIAHSFSNSNQMWNERLISNSISQAVLILIEQEFYVDLIQNSKEKEKGITQIFQILNNFQKQAIKKIQNIKFQQKIQQAYALADCFFMIKQIINLQQNIANKPEGVKNNNNLLLTLAKNLLLQRKKQYKSIKQQKKINQSCNEKIFKQPIQDHISQDKTIREEVCRMPYQNQYKLCIPAYQKTATYLEFYMSSEGFFYYNINQSEGKTWQMPKMQIQKQNKQQGKNIDKLLKCKYLLVKDNKNENEQQMEMENMYDPLRFQTYQIKCFQGHKQTSASHLNMTKGRYILKIKFYNQQKNTQYLIKYLCSHNLKLKEVNLSKEETNKLLNDALVFKIDRVRHFNLDRTLNYQKIAFGNTFDEVGYGFVGIQLKKNCTYKLQIDVDPLILKNEGYKLKGNFKKQTSTFSVIVNPGQRITLVLKKLKEEEKKPYKWPPTGIVIRNQGKVVRIQKF